MRVYLDHNATTLLGSEARAATIAAMDVVGNPSSVHAEGRAAKALVEKARAQVAGLAGCAPSEVVFTSGATESARVLAGMPYGHAVWVDPTSHDALLAHAHGLDAADTATLAMGLANSETGIISRFPVQEDGKWIFGARRADWLLLDMTQAAGRIPFDFAASNADFAILSAHKLGGPKGVGALIIRQGLDITSLSSGGGQEMGRRSGTENVVGIAGFGAAAESAVRDVANGRWEEVAEKRDLLETALEAGDYPTILVGKGVARLPNTSCIIAPGWKGETQVMQMDLSGFAISAGSACSSGKVRASTVLRAMGFDDLHASSAIRVSLGLETTKYDVLRFADTWLAKRHGHEARAA